MSKIYITSDLHFGHNRDFLYQPRGFASIEEHDSVVIGRFNSIVTDEDDVYILGDLMLNDNEHGMECLRQLHGRLHIVRGNHDTDSRMALYISLPAVVEVKDIINLKYKGYHFYCSHYPTITSNNDIDKPLKAKVLNLCGHTHTQDKWANWDPWFCYHVELDAHDCFPVSLDTIIEDIKNKVSASKQKDAIKSIVFPVSRCAKCVWYRVSCNGLQPWCNITTCPPGLKYKRDPPDGGYYG